jgi:hypothetical protein
MIQEPIKYELFVRYSENMGDWQYSHRLQREDWVEQITEYWDVLQVKASEDLATVLSAFEEKGGNEFKFISVTRV